MTSLYDDGYDVCTVDVTAQELVSGDASIWDDVIYKVYFLCCDQTSHERAKSAPTGSIPTEKAKAEKLSAAFQRTITSKNPKHTSDKQSTKNPGIVETAVGSHQNEYFTPHKSSDATPVKKKQREKINKEASKKPTTESTAPSSTPRPSTNTRSKHTDLQQPAMTFSIEKDNKVLPNAAKPVGSSRAHGLDEIISRFLFAGKTRTDKEKTTRPAIVRRLNRSSSRPSCLVPLRLDPSEEEQQEIDNFTPAPVTESDMHDVRRWMGSLGVFVLEGEAGYSYTTAQQSVPSSSCPREMTKTGLTVASQSSSSLSVQPDLLADKLRNGVSLCDLLLILEPAACGHISMNKSLQRSPRTLEAAGRNVCAALWVLRMRSSPPIPGALLLQPKQILSGSKQVLWGLLKAVMDTYSKVVLRGVETVIATRELPYTPDQMRALSTSLAQV